MCQQKINKAFTLIEIVIVIALIWLSALFMPTIDFNKKTEREKRDRFSNVIVSTIKTELANSVSWRWFIDGTVVKNPDYSYIIIKDNTIWSLYSLPSWIIKTWLYLQTPFMDQDVNYKINKIDYIKKDNSTGSVVLSTWLKIVFKNWEASFSWITSWDDAVAIKITAWYADTWTLDPYYNDIYFDRRSWAINVKVVP